MVISLRIPWDFQLQEEYTRWEAVSPDEAEKIPMFHADFLCCTSKIVEYSRYLPIGYGKLCALSPGDTALPSPLFEG